jgi:hypothetical protein
MNKFIKILPALLMASVVGSSPMTDADAATVPGASGNARLPGELGCFQRDFGRIANTGCSGQRRVTIGSPVFTGVTGSRAFSATGCSGSPGNVSSCSVSILGADGWRKGGSGDIQLTSCPVIGGGGISAKALGTFSVAGTDAVVFECLLSPASPSSPGNPQTFTNFVGSLTF